MKINYDITEEDYWRFCKYAIKTIPQVRYRFLKSVVAVPLIVFMISYYSGHIGTRLAVDIITAGVFGYFGITYFTRRSSIKMARHHPGILCQHVIEVCADGFWEQTMVNKSFHNWDAINRIEADKNYIYFVLGLMAFGIPRKAFLSEDESEHFFQSTLLFWEENKKIKA